jgi:fatty-acyl-CoA synthase
MSPVATILKPEDQLAKAGSAGKPVINVETRLMDDEGNFVGVGEVGEIVHRSGQVMSGYLGVIGGNGYLYVVDRKKDMIKTCGENVASREVEEVIYTHPAVEAVVVPKNGARVGDKDIIDFCKERLAGFKFPPKVFIAEELVKNPSGKILKRELRQKYAA